MRLHLPNSSPHSGDPLRKTAVDWIRRTLLSCAPVSDMSAAGERAEAMHSIAEAYGVSIDTLIQWIIARGRGEEYTILEFRRYAQKHQESKIMAEREAQQRQAPSGYPD